MSAEPNDQVLVGPPQAQVTLICPETKRPLREREGEIVSLDITGNVLRLWKKQNGFFDLIVGDRFEDKTDDARRRYEVESNIYSAEHYWIPLFQNLFPGYAKTKYRLLAIGCGVGVEVDLIAKAGFACFGIDNGNRTEAWPSLHNTEGLLLANAMHLPFADGTFDATFCGCVFPHVGVVGDTNRVSEHYAANRQKVASEMVRVTRKGGYVIACSPNRRFCFDIFHDRRPGSYKPKLNPPWSRFLLSVSDYRRMFRIAGCQSIKTLPVNGFWGFVTMRKSLKGRILSFPIRLAFNIASNPACSFLRPSPLIPWIAVRAQV
jgi:SAM-dependent methyltransferase